MILLIYMYSEEKKKCDSQINSYSPFNFGFDST